MGSYMCNRCPMPEGFAVVGTVDQLKRRLEELF